jgi:hypothetical protein
MHEYSNVEVILLDDQQLKDQKGNKNVLSIKKDSEKSYSILVKGGNIFLFFDNNVGFFFCLGSSTGLTISVDESLENVRSGSAGIVISLPKQKHLSYLLKFANQEGKLTNLITLLFTYLIDAINFNKLLGSIKSGKSIEEGETSQFDERTEESSAQQYFQVKIFI